MALGCDTATRVTLRNALKIISYWVVPDKYHAYYAAERYPKVIVPDPTVRRLVFRLD